MGGNGDTPIVLDPCQCGHNGQQGEEILFTSCPWGKSGPHLLRPVQWEMLLNYLMGTRKEVSRLAGCGRGIVNKETWYMEVAEEAEEANVTK